MAASPETTARNEAPVHGFRGEAPDDGPAARPRGLTVAVSREAGARGTTLARKVGELLGWQVFDQDLLDYLQMNDGERGRLLADIPASAKDWADAHLARLQRAGRLDADGDTARLYRLLFAVAARGPANDDGAPDVTQVASGGSNPLRYRRLVDLVQRYFTEHPIYDRDGAPIVVPEWTFPGRGRVQKQLETAQNVMDKAEKLLHALPLRGKQAELSARLDALRAMQAKVQTEGKLKRWLATHGLESLQGLWTQIHIEPGWESALEATLREKLNALEVGRIETVRAFAGDAPPAKLAFYTRPSAATAGTCSTTPSRTARRHSSGIRPSSPSGTAAPCAPRCSPGARTRCCAPRPFAASRRSAPASARASCPSGST